MARRATGTTRHTISVSTIFSGFFRFGGFGFNHCWQRNSGQFGALGRRSFLRFDVCTDVCFDHIVSKAYFLRQLTLFTARHDLNAFFLFSILLWTFFAIQRFHILLSLTFIVRTAAVALATRLLLIAALRLLSFISDNLANFTRFSRLLLGLAAVTAVLFTRFARLVAGAVIAVFTRLTAFTIVAV